MALTLATPPASEPVTLSEAKAHLNIVDSADDTLLADLITAAVASLDGPFGDLGRCLITQSWVLTLDAFPAGAIELPLPPIITIDAVKYLDATGAETTIDASAYRVTGLGSDRKARVEHLTSWPSTYPFRGAVSVEFTAGYGSADDVPDDLKNLILSRVASSFATRESTNVGNVQPGRNVETDAILDRYRTRGF